ncbi:hypothetical protein BLNAU_12028 [Blattamonas nauphoetae]|uniref:Uncharacterized protein n=1 Tax=Blattamonas nauphoetae TaxID=2049346 RepID=A0ABQ9XNE4_9EUKA|nr:hypothetical protein BLNAU_12028 [Blattamonas nauphoetae]
MTEIDEKTAPSSSTARSDLSSPPFQFSLDCSAFLNWNEEEPQSEEEMAVVIRSLVATVKLQPALDDSLEDKAMKCLKSIHLKNRASAEAFLISLGKSAENSSSGFVQSIVVLVSSTSRVITTAAMKILDYLIWSCSTKIGLALVQAGLIPQLVNTLNPQYLSFVDAILIHINLSIIIHKSLWLTTPYGLEDLGIEDQNEQLAAHETILQQVIVPSEKYIWHLCVHRFSIIDSDQSTAFLTILAQLLRISLCYQPTMDFVLNMPVVLTIPSYLTFLEVESSIYWFLFYIIAGQREWNKKMGQKRQMWKNVLQMLRKEGFEDMIETKLQNDKRTRVGSVIVGDLIKLTNFLDMNLPEQE